MSSQPNGPSDDDPYELDDEYTVSPPIDRPPIAVPKPLAPSESIKRGARPKPPRRPMISGIFTFPWYVSSLATWVLIVLGMTVAAVLLAFCYQLLNTMFVAGRIIALPVGIIVTLAASYASANYLAVVQATSEGIDGIEDWPEGEYREWFWTLPYSLGMLAAAGVVGYFVNLVVWTQSWIPMVSVMLILYPVFQLSSLEAGSPMIPLSKPILATLWKYPRGWAVFYAGSALPIAILLWIFCECFPRQPYVTILVFAPLAAAVLLIYGRMLGRLAWWCATDGGRQA